MCHSIKIILCLGLLVPAIFGDHSGISEETASQSDNEETKHSDVKENENIALTRQMDELTPVQKKVMAVQDMINQLKKYNAFWDKLSADKSQESMEENSEEIPEPEENPSGKIKRIKYVKKKSKKSEESIDENDELDSVEESTGSIEDTDQSDESAEVETQIREKGNVFNKKRLKEDASVSYLGNADYDNDKDFSVEQDDFIVDKETLDNGDKNTNVNAIDLSKPSKGDRHDVLDAISYRDKKNLSTKSENSEVTKSIPINPSSKPTINSKETNKQDEFENQLKGQKEIAEPIMFRNRSDSHPTTQKPMNPLFKISKEFLMAKYLPAISMMRLKAQNVEAKRDMKIPESDEDLSSDFNQATPRFYEFQDDTTEGHTYDFRMESNQDMPSSDESFAVAELLDDGILNSKSSALVVPSSDEQGHLRQGLDLIDESNLNDFNERSSEETLEPETIKNKDITGNNDSEEDKSNEQENSENELRSNEQTKLGKSSGSLGRYHRIRDVSRTAAM